MVTRVSRTEAARHLGVSISTIDRRIQRGELSVEKEGYGSRERVYVLLDEDLSALAAADAPVPAGATARGSLGDTTTGYVMTLEHQVQSLQGACRLPSEGASGVGAALSAGFGQPDHRSTDHRENVQGAAGAGGDTVRGPELPELVAMAEEGVAPIVSPF